MWRNRASPACRQASDWAGARRWRSQRGPSPSDALSIVTRIIVAPDGTVDTSVIVASDIDNRALECCVSSHMAALVFDKPSGEES